MVKMNWKIILSIGIVLAFLMPTSMIAGTEKAVEGKSSQITEQDEIEIDINHTNNAMDKRDFQGLSIEKRSNPSTQYARSFAKMLNVDMQEILLIAAELQGIHIGKMDYSHEFTSTPLKSAILEAYEIYGMNPLDEDILKLQEINNLPVDLQKAIALILYSMNDATLLCKQAFENLSDEEMKFLENSMNEMMQPSLMKDRPSYAKANRKFEEEMIQWNGFSKQKKLFEEYKNIEGKVDMKKMIKGGMIVTSAIENAMPILKKFSNFDFGDSIISFWPFLAIGGLYPNHYEKNYFLIIDLGGNDIYENNAGGPVFWMWIGNGWFTPSPGQVSVCIDLWGDDIYKTIGGQGYGRFFGIGILIDKFGKDEYSRSPKERGVFHGQGVGRDFSIGILVDEFGDDKYSYGIEGYGQGAGIDGGIGILIDFGGDDEFYSSETNCQGFGERGIGILINIGGVDEYSGPGRNWWIWFQGTIGIGIDIGSNLLKSKSKQDHRVSTSMVTV
jgi:hypothetical protein